jgi:receptor protein-tyrosine kinase
LASQRSADVLLALRSECDVVLVDSPPVLPVTDSIVLSRMVDATILVGTAGRTTRKEYQRAVELLRQVDAPLIGSVLNGVEQEDLYGFGYGYGYYRSGDDVDVVEEVAAGEEPERNGRRRPGAGGGGAGARAVQSAARAAEGWAPWPHAAIEEGLQLGLKSIQHTACAYCYACE